MSCASFSKKKGGTILFRQREFQSCYERKRWRFAGSWQQWTEGWRCLVWWKLRPRVESCSSPSKLMLCPTALALSVPIDLDSLHFCSLKRLGKFVRTSIELLWYSSFEELCKGSISGASVDLHHPKEYVLFCLYFISPLADVLEDAVSRQ